MSLLMCHICCVRFEVPTLVLLKIPALWDVALVLEWVDPNILKVHSVSVFRVQQIVVQDKAVNSFWAAWPWKWRCYGPSKQQEAPAHPLNITSQTTGIYFWLVQFGPRMWYWWIGFQFPGEEQVFLFSPTAHRPTLGPAHFHSKWVIGAVERW